MRPARRRELLIPHDPCMDPLPQTQAPPTDGRPKSVVVNLNRAASSWLLNDSRPVGLIPHRGPNHHDCCQQQHEMSSLRDLLTRLTLACCGGPRQHRQHHRRLKAEPRHSPPARWPKALMSRSITSAALWKEIYSYKSSMCLFLTAIKMRIT